MISPNRLFLAMALFISAMMMYSCSNDTIVNSPDDNFQAQSLGKTEAVSWPVVKKGDIKIEVKAVQYLLKHRGYSITVDGNFGSGTETVVKSFQSANGLTADGIVGSATWQKLIVTVKNGTTGEAVKAVQDLLKNKFGYSLTIDGAFGSGTETAVKNFQSRNGLTADGVVGSNTWMYLTGLSGDFWGSRIATWVFPVKSSVLDIYSGSRYFGASRDNGARAHAGVDLVPTNGPGTNVVAMTNGTVLNYYLFYGGTYALEVKNDDGTIARYCEITSTFRAGNRVSKGQVIGQIIRNNIGGSYMLHLEMYMGNGSGSLTNSSNSTYWYVPYKNYQRRSDLLDPMGVINLPR